MTDTALQQKRLIAAVVDIGIAVAGAVGIWIILIIVGLAAGMISGVVGHYAHRILIWIGSLVILGYVLGRDALANGRSLGKKTQDLKVVGATGAPIGLEESVRRNAIFAVGPILGVVSSTLGLIPFVGAAVNCLLTPLYLLGSLATFGAAIVEVVKIIQDPAGIRFGDQYARTRVVRV